MAFTSKQAAFIDEYLIDFNATQAAIRAGYSEKTARSQGNRMLTNVDILEEVKQRVSERSMSADEALIRLAEQARSEYSEYFTNLGNVDVARMVASGKAHLIKSIKETAHGTNIEFHDSQAALFKLIEIHGLTKHKVELSGPENGAIPITYTDYRTALSANDSTESKE